MVFMLNPSVGLMVVMSSPFRRFTIVVFPALSRPLSAHAVRCPHVLVHVLACGMHGKRSNRSA